MGLSDLSRHGVPMRWLYRALPTASLPIEDFSGGLDLNQRINTDSPRHLLRAQNIDFRGGRARWREGYTALTGVPSPASGWDFGMYSATFDAAFIASEIGTGGSAPWIYKVTAFTSTAATFTDVSAGLPFLGGTTTKGAISGIDIVEFNGALVMPYIASSSANSGIYVYTGTVWTRVNSTVKGCSIAVWQNKLWVCGDPDNPSRVWFSKAGDYTTWDALDYVDVREGADSPLTALHTTREMDIQGRPSLLAFKSNSVHRINDPTTGAYSTLAVDSGAKTRFAIASQAGMTAYIHDSGIYATNGTSRPEKISGPVDPYFSRSTNLIQRPTAVGWQGQLRFAIGGPPQTLFPNVTLVFDVASRTWAQERYHGHTNGVRAWFTIPAGACSGGGGTTYDRNRLFSFDMGASSIQSNTMFWMFPASTSTAGDNGAANQVAIIQTPYLELGGGTRFRIQRVRLSLAGFNGTWSASAPLTLRVRRDWSSTDSVVRQVTSGTAPRTVSDYDFDRLGDCRNASFIVELPPGTTSDLSNPYRPDTVAVDTAELVRMLIEYTPTGQT